MYLDNQVIKTIQGFSFEVVSYQGDAFGDIQYQAVICNDQMYWTKKVGFKTDDYKEAENELRYYMDRGFRFGKVEFKPNRKKVAAS